MSMTAPAGVPVLPPMFPYGARPPNFGGSFVAPLSRPLAPMPPMLAPQGIPPEVRKALTEGIPDPSAVQRQKETFARSLEEQLRKGVEVLAATHKQQTDQLHEQANMEKERYNRMLDQQVKARELELSQQYNEQLMRLQQAAQAQRAELEQQACGLTLEYQQRKVTEEYMAQQQGIQKQHIEAHQRINAEIQKHLGGCGPGTQAALLEKVHANMQPLASYAIPPPLAMPASAPLPTAAPGVLPYVPPPTFKVVPPQLMPTLSNVPPVLHGASLSYMPPGVAMHVPVPQTRSFVPPTMRP